ncbi:MAG: hypothetical protein K0Q49_471 [Haloplasmataceae bacterium]|jgi:hypothetical protein|nr:hypothetical protein [Haloplasmataceae bacterium]
MRKRKIEVIPYKVSSETSQIIAELIEWSGESQTLILEKMLIAFLNENQEFITDKANEKKDNIKTTNALIKLGFGEKIEEIKNGAA